jgi:xylan 1,4-beta-xylosidase
LFHDDDGRKWLANMLWDHRKGRNPFAGIVLQEYDPKQKKLVGPIKNIFKGTEIELTEGPHLYKHSEYYYLLTAEGGTSYEHAVTMARSKNIDGPYEVDPTNPILTSRYDPNLELQRAGHASIVQTQNDEWYMVHLCGRPFKCETKPKFRCSLGRETAIQKCYWTDDGWLRLKSGNTPAVIVEGPDLPEFAFNHELTRDDFDNETLNVNFNTLRVPADESWLSLKERPGFLRLKGRESLASIHNQSLVARRVQSFKCQITTQVEFQPKNFQQMAGLVCFYDVQNYFYLRIGHYDEFGAHLGIVTCDNGLYDEFTEYEVSLNGKKDCYLRAEFDNGILQFSYSFDEKSWKKIGPSFDATRLSDEYCNEGCFTGTFVGLCCQDISGTRHHADFDFFEYEELS